MEVNHWQPEHRDHVYTHTTQREMPPLHVLHGGQIMVNKCHVQYWLKKTYLGLLPICIMGMTLECKSSLQCFPSCWAGWARPADDRKVGMLSRVEQGWAEWGWARVSESDSWRQGVCSLLLWRNTAGWLPSTRRYTGIQQSLSTVTSTIRSRLKTNKL